MSDLGIYLEVGLFNKLKISVIKKGKTLSPFSPDIPSILRPMAKDTFSYDSVETGLLTFLRDHGDTYPVYVKDDLTQTLVKLRWDPDFRLTARTQFNLFSDQVVVHRVGYCADRLYMDLMLYGETLVVDLETQVIGELVSADGWVSWTQFLPNVTTVSKKEMAPQSYTSHRRFKKTKSRLSQEPEDVNQTLVQAGVTTVFKPIIVSWKQFNDFQITYEVSRKSAFWDMVEVRSEDQPVSLSAFNAQYRAIGVIESLNSKVHLEGHCSVNGVDIPLSRHVQDTLLAFLDLPPVLNSVRSRELLIATLLKAVEGDVNSIETLIQEVLTDEQFKPDSLAEAARDFLNRILSLLLVPRERLVVINGEWGVVTVDGSLEARLYTSVFLLFGEPVLKELMPDGFWISRRAFQQHLALLSAQYQLYGIVLNMGERSVENVKLDFNFAATWMSDWFELHPDITFNGQAVSSAFLAQLLESEGVVHTEDGSVQVVDQDTLQILKVLQSLSPDQFASQSDKKEKTYVRLSRLQIFDWLALRHLGVDITISGDEDRILKTLTQLESLEKLPIPKGFSGELWEYQREGYSWLRFLYDNRFGACLADDMGLGKTVQAICFLVGLFEDKKIQAHRSQWGPFLIVVPPSILFNWHKELTRFYPAFRVMEFSDVSQITQMDSVDVVLITYEMVRRYIDVLEPLPFHVIIFDEAQMIKNMQAARTSAVRKLNGRFKVCLTGTPLENHLGEYYSIIDLALPGLLGDYDVFQKDIKSGDFRLLIHRSKPFVLRRTKNRILPDLPPKMESNVLLNLSDKQRQFYVSVVKEVRQEVDRVFRSTQSGKAKLLALTAILRLRQICVSPQLLDESFDEPSPKMEYLLDRLQLLRDEGHSAVVFSQFRQFLDVLGKYLDKSGVSYLRMDGKTPVAKRKSLVESFQNSDGSTVFLVSLKTGGVGLNLTKASYVFHLDPWWNPSVENQASDRVHRIGQTQKVFVERLLMHHTIEEKMITLKEKKQTLFDSIMESGFADQSKLNLTKDDFDFLLDT